MVSRAWNICQKIFLTNYNKKKANESASKEKKSEMVGATSSVSSPNNNANQDASVKSSLTPKNEGAESIQWISFLGDRKPRVHGFDNEIMSLKKLLGTREDGDKFKGVGVVGTRGVGKTTLCQEFYRRLTEEQLKETGSPTFSPRVWVSMPKPSSQKEDSTGRKIAVLERILKSLDQEEKIMDVTGEFASSTGDDKLIVLLYVLRLQLLGKKYLVVLDDVQEADSWCKNLFESVSLHNISDPGVCLASGLPKASGGTVIVTTREEKAAKMMIGDGNLHRLLPLVSDNTSLWEIFKDAVDGLQPKLNMEILKEKIMKNCEELQFFGKSIDMMKILEGKVVSKCNGLPLAAILMAKTMPEQVDLMEKRKKMRVKEAQNKGGSKEKTDEPQKKDTGGDMKSVLLSSKEGKVQDDQGGPTPSTETLEGPNRGQEGKSVDEETLGKEEETEQKEDVQEKEEAKGTDDQTQEVAKHDAEVASQKKDDQGEGKEGEAEKIPEEAKQVQGEDHGHDAKVESSMKDDDQKAKETKDHEVEAPKKEEEAPKEAKETQVQEEDHGHDAKVESPKKDEDQKTKETKDHEVEAPKKEEEAPNKAKETQVQGEDHGLHDAEVGSPNKDEDQKATETKDHEVVAPKKLEEEGPKEVMETQVQAEALEKKEELPEKQEHVQEEAKAAS